MIIEFNTTELHRRISLKITNNGRFYIEQYYEASDNLPGIFNKEKKRN